MAQRPPTSSIPTYTILKPARRISNALNMERHEIKNASQNPTYRAEASVATLPKGLVTPQFDNHLKEEERMKSSSMSNVSNRLDVLNTARSEVQSNSNEGGSQSFLSPPASEIKD